MAGAEMFDTIILLTGPIEQAALGTVLHRHRRALSIHPAANSADIAALGDALLGRSRLIAFSTPVIVPPRVLDGLGYGAYNFHPGSPQYPGWAPSHFALYEQAESFGATVHAMLERVDSGPIVDVALFPVPEDINVAGLESLAYTHLAKLFWKLASTLAIQPGPLPALPVHWSGKTNSRRTYRELCEIPLDIGKDEFDRRMRVFGGDHGDMAPTISLHGVPFRAARDSELPSRTSSRSNDATPRMSASGA
jgi:methionyl-tRNA formyltransferase